MQTLPIIQRILTKDWQSYNPGVVIIQRILTKDWQSYNPGVVAGTQAALIVGPIFVFIAILLFVKISSK